jgi:hypothetical protein
MRVPGPALVRTSFSSFETIEAFPEPDAHAQGRIIGHPIDPRNAAAAAPYWTDNALQ